MQNSNEEENANNYKQYPLMQDGFVIKSNHIKNQPAIKLSRLPLCSSCARQMLHSLS